MKVSLFTSLFQKKSIRLQTHDSILIKKLKKLSQENNFLLFKNTNIYHNSDVYPTKLILIYPAGVYIFETKEWTYKELKDATAEKASQQDSSVKTLSFDKTHDMVQKKLDSIKDARIEIFNYLIMEYLSKDEYSHLNTSLQDSLPSQKIIFSDSDDNEILQKLSNTTTDLGSDNNVNRVASSVFVQYSFLKEDLTNTLCTPEQIAFLDKEILNVTHLQGLPRSGKSTLLLLKSIFLIIEKKAKNILIVKPTILSADILKKRLLSILEHSMLTIDLTAINIISQSKFKEMNTKKMDNFDIIMCDDIHLLEKTFVTTLKEKSKKFKLILVNDENAEQETPLQTFKKQNSKTSFIKANPHNTVLSLVKKLLKKNEEKILIICNEKNREKLLSELQTAQIDASMLQAQTSLMNQQFTNVLLADAKDINSLSPHHVIIMDLYSASVNEIEYTLNLADKSVSVLYEKNSQEIKDLRKKYEGS